MFKSREMPPEDVEFKAFVERQEIEAKQMKEEYDKKYNPKPEIKICPHCGKDINAPVDVKTPEQIIKEVKSKRTVK